MKSSSVLAILLLVVMPVQAAPWEFGVPLTIAASQPGVFHHLESAGRQGIAVSDHTVAVVWEDNRDGTPRSYVGFRDAESDGFQVHRLSNEQDAYEPVVAALTDGRFVFGWEEGGEVWIRTGSPAQLDPPLRFSRHGAAQVSFAAGDRDVYVAWAEQRGRHPAIQVARLMRSSSGAAPRLSSPATVTANAPADQLYPALVVLRTGLLVAWEDRRAGHTRIFYAHSRDGRTFSSARLLNEQLARRSQTYGRGTGAARVVLARVGAARATAVWLDKRDFEGGYDIYSADTGSDSRRFGPNHLVQDEFGANIGQWHAALAGHVDGLAVCIWDDDRDGSPDLWLSWRTPDGWSGNLGVPGATGPGIESNPVIALDADGNAHLAWTEQERTAGPTHLRYLVGRRVPLPRP